MNLIKTIIAALLIVSVSLLAGCVISEPITLPDGTQGLSIECDGQVQGLAACYKKAAEECGTKGYTVVKEDREQSRSGDVYADEDSLYGTEGEVINRWIMIKCGRDGGSQ